MSQTWLVASSLLGGLSLQVAPHSLEPPESWGGWSHWLLKAARSFWGLPHIKGFPHCLEPCGHIQGLFPLWERVPAALTSPSRATVVQFPLLDLPCLKILAVGPEPRQDLRRGKRYFSPFLPHPETIWGPTSPRPVMRDKRDEEATGNWTKLVDSGLT